MYKSYWLESVNLEFLHDDVDLKRVPTVSLFYNVTVEYIEKIDITILQSTLILSSRVKNNTVT